MACDDGNYFHPPMQLLIMETMKSFPLVSWLLKHRKEEKKLLLYCKLFFFPGKTPSAMIMNRNRRGYCRHAWAKTKSVNLFLIAFCHYFHCKCLLLFYFSCGNY